MIRWTLEVVVPAEREIERLSDELQARFLHVAEMLVELGPARVGMPHVRHLDDKLWEMRLAGRDRIARALYVTVPPRRIVVLRVFVKKSQRTPRRELELAMRRAAEVMNG